MKFTKWFAIIVLVCSSMVFAQTTKPTEDEAFTALKGLRTGPAIIAYKQFWTDYPTASLEHKTAVAAFLGESLLSKEPAESLKFNQWLVNNGSPQYRGNLARSYTHLKNYPAALSEVDKWIAELPVKSADLESESKADNAYYVKADILYASGDQVAAKALLQQRKTKGVVEHQVLAYNRLIRWATTNEQATLIDEAFAAHPAYFALAKVNLLVSQKKPADAIAVIEGLSVVSAPIASIYADLQTGKPEGAALVNAAVVKMLKTRSPGSLSTAESALLRKIVPGNDAINCMLTDAQGVADGYKNYLRKQSGRIDNTPVATFVKQLNTGDGTKALVITNEAKALAAAISAGDVQMAPFLVPMLNGDYKTAAKLAFAQAKASENDATYSFWISALSSAVRCQDQCYNKRAIDVIKWVNGEVAQNPVEDLLK